MLGVIHRVLLWADVNTATPLGAWGRSVMSLAPIRVPAQRNGGPRAKLFCIPMQPRALNDGDGSTNSTSGKMAPHNSFVPTQVPVHVTH